MVIVDWSRVRSPGWFNVLSANMEEAMVYDLYHSQPPGGDLDVLASLHVLHLYLQSVILLDVVAVTASLLTCCPRFIAKQEQETPNWKRKTMKRITMY